MAQRNKIYKKNIILIVGFVSSWDLLVINNNNKKKYKMSLNLSFNMMIYGMKQSFYTPLPLQCCCLSDMNLLSVGVCLNHQQEKEGHCGEAAQLCGRHPH